jgi:site-specific recombinase XerD
MATFLVKLDTRRKLSDETYPLIIRIHSGSKRRDINLKTYLLESQFDVSSQRVNNKHPSKKLINQMIQTKLLQLQEVTLKLEIQDEILSAGKIKTTVVKPIHKLNFFQYGNGIVEQMNLVGRVGNATAYRDALTALKTYSGKTELQFKEVNYELLCTVENKMLAAGLKKNSIAAYNRALRAIFNKAINEDLIDVKFYPYRKFKIKGEATTKRNISKENIKAIAEMKLEENSQLWHSRNYFMLSFYLRGMSYADMASIKPTDLVDGRLIYKRKKTHKPYNVKLIDKAKELISKYQREGATYILPALADNISPNTHKERVTIQQAIKVCNKYLERIGNELKLPQKLTTYFARHSWATIAKRGGYSKDMISEALGHSQGSKITEIYLDKFDQEIIDDMNEAVCNF